MYTWTQLQTRAAYLMGETSASAILQSHLNAAIKEICNSYNFSWNLKTTALTLVAGVSNLPTDYNASWHIKDARIVVSGQGGDTVFTEIDITNRDRYSSDNYVYWISFDTTTNRWIFNSLTQTGSVTIYYNFVPADLSTGTDNCVVPDGEAVAYLGCAKMWLGDERNQTLKNDFEQEANGRIQVMYTHDLAFGDTPVVTSLVSDNDTLLGQ